MKTLSWIGRMVKVAAEVLVAYACPSLYASSDVFDNE